MSSEPSDFGPGASSPVFTLARSLRIRNANIAEFQRLVNEWAASKPKQAVFIFQRKLAFEAFNGVVKLTPVDTGRARGNWQIEIGSIPTTVLDRTDEGEIGAGPSPALAAELVKLNNINNFTIIYIVNNVGYILYLEQGRPGPGSPQAPNGMVAVTLIRLRRIFA